MLLPIQKLNNRNKRMAQTLLGLSWWLSGQESACNAGNAVSIPGSGRSPGEGNGNPLQHSCWKNPWTEEPDRPQSMGSQRVGHD